jgi:hypothetical protein
MFEIDDLMFEKLATNAIINYLYYKDLELYTELPNAAHGWLPILMDIISDGAPEPASSQPLLTANRTTHPDLFEEQLKILNQFNYYFGMGVGLLVQFWSHSNNAPWLDDKNFNLGREQLEKHKCFTKKAG